MSPLVLEGQTDISGDPGPLEDFESLCVAGLSNSEDRQFTFDLGSLSSYVDNPAQIPYGDYEVPERIWSNSGLQRSVIEGLQNQGASEFALQCLENLAVSGNQHALYALLQTHRTANIEIECSGGSHGELLKVFCVQLENSIIRNYKVLQEKFPHVDIGRVIIEQRSGIRQREFVDNVVCQQSGLVRESIFLGEDQLEDQLLDRGLLVHLSNTFPQNGFIYPTNDYRPMVPRTSLHCCINSAVTPNDGGAWDQSRIAVILPITKEIIGRTMALYPSDTWVDAKGGLELPEGSTVLIERFAGIQQGVIDEEGSLLIPCGKATVKIVDLDRWFSIDLAVETTILESGYPIKGVGARDFTCSRIQREYSDGFGRMDNDTHAIRTLAAEMGIPSSLASSFPESQIETLPYSNYGPLVLKQLVMIGLLHNGRNGAEVLPSFSLTESDHSASSQVMFALETALLNPQILTDRLFAKVFELLILSNDFPKKHDYHNSIETWLAAEERDRAKLIEDILNMPMGTSLRRIVNYNSLGAAYQWDRPPLATIEDLCAFPYPDPGEELTAVRGNAFANSLIHVSPQAFTRHEAMINHQLSICDSVLQDTYIPLMNILNQYGTGRVLPEKV